MHEGEGGDGTRKHRHPGMLHRPANTGIVNISITGAGYHELTRHLVFLSIFIFTPLSVTSSTGFIFEKKNGKKISIKKPFKEFPPANLFAYFVYLLTINYLF